MNTLTREAIRAHFREFVLGQMPKMTKWTIDDLKEAYPFHRLFFTGEALVAARVERSVVTNMGNTLYQDLAKIVALDRYKQVYLGHDIESTLNDAAVNMIEQIVTELRAPVNQGETPRKPDHDSELADILSSPGGGQSTRVVKADLYVEDFTGGPLFIELKTPLPNLDIAAESKRKMLYYLAMMDRKGVAGAKAFLGLTYNPYITRAKYGHSFTKKIMDMNKQVLIGSETWDYIGGPGTYVEILQIIDQVRGEVFGT